MWNYLLIFSILGISRVVLVQTRHHHVQQQQPQYYRNNYDNFNNRRFDVRERFNGGENGIHHVYWRNLHQKDGRTQGQCLVTPEYCVDPYTCKSTLGELAICNTDFDDELMKRCECCHMTEKIGIANHKCHFVRDMGASCNDTAECTLGNGGSYSICNERKICTGSSASGILPSLGILAFAFLAFVRC